MWWCQADDSASQTHVWSVEPLYAEIVHGSEGLSGSEGVQASNGEQGSDRALSAPAFEAKNSGLREQTEEDCGVSVEDTLTEVPAKHEKRHSEAVIAAVEPLLVIPLPDLTSNQRHSGTNHSSETQQKRSAFPAEPWQDKSTIAQLRTEKQTLEQEAARLHSLVDELEELIVQQQHQASDLKRELALERESATQQGDLLRQAEIQAAEAREQTQAAKNELQEHIRNAEQESARQEAILRATYAKKVRCLRREAEHLRQQESLREFALQSLVASLVQQEHFVEELRCLNDDARVAHENESQELESQIDRLTREFDAFRRMAAEDLESERQQNASRIESERLLSIQQIETQKKTEKKVRFLRRLWFEERDARVESEQGLRVFLERLLGHEVRLRDEEWRNDQLADNAKCSAQVVELLCEGVHHERVARLEIDFETRLRASEDRQQIELLEGGIEELQVLLQNEQEAARTRQASVSSQLDCANAQISRLELQLAKANDEIREEHERRESAAGKRSRKHREKVRALRGEIAWLEQQYATARQACRLEISRSTLQEAETHKQQSQNASLNESLSQAFQKHEGLAIESTQLEDQLRFYATFLESMAGCHEPIEKFIRQTSKTEKQLQQKLDLQSRELDSTRDALHQSTHCVASLEETKRGLEQQLADAELRYKELEQECRKLESSFHESGHSSAQKLAQVEDEASRMQRCIKVMSVAHENAMVALDQQHCKDQVSLQDEFERQIATERELHRTQANQAKDLRETLQAQLDAAETRLKSQSTERASAESSLRIQYGQLLAELEDALAKRQEKWKSLLQERNLVEQQLIECEDALQQAKQELCETQKGLSEQNADAERQEKLVNTLRSRVAELETVCEQNVRSIEELRKKEARLQESAQESCQESQRLTLELAAASEELILRRRQVQEIKNRIDGEEARLAASEKQVQELLDCEKENNRQLALLEFQNEALRKKLINQVGARRRAELAIRMAALDNEKGAGARAAISEINQQTKIERLEKEVKATRHALDHYRKKAHRLKSSLQSSQVPNDITVDVAAQVPKERPSGGL